MRLEACLAPVLLVTVDFGVFRGLKAFFFDKSGQGGKV